MQNNNATFDFKKWSGFKNVSFFIFRPERTIGNKFGYTDIFNGLGKQQMASEVDGFGSIDILNGLGCQRIWLQ